MGEREQVVILHGIWRTSRHMRTLAAYLASQGYLVHNFDYPSTTYPLEILVERVWDDMHVIIRHDQPLHLVGYSMGGLLVRALIHAYRPGNLGRAVLLAAPNHGSEIADLLQHNWLYKRCYGPAGQQLITDQRQIAHLFGPVDYECGIIAGTRSLDPFCALFMKNVHDGKVSVESTKLDGMTDHITVPTTHTWFPHHRGVQRHTAHFLRHGYFAR
ncbi:MAG: alpha/beta fold hydrolase [Sphaerospermopsis sp. SIO1G2]|nr:alpha/beta fold hydrolase [Sphaerospermopsis sp. SIO1G2]